MPISGGGGGMSAAEKAMSFVTTSAEGGLTGESVKPYVEGESSSLREEHGEHNLGSGAVAAGGEWDSGDISFATAFTSTPMVICQAEGTSEAYADNARAFQLGTYVTTTTCAIWARNSSAAEKYKERADAHWIAIGS